MREKEGVCLREMGEEDPTVSREEEGSEANVYGLVFVSSLSFLPSGPKNNFFPHRYLELFEWFCGLGQGEKRSW